MLRTIRNSRLAAKRIGVVLCLTVGMATFAVVAPAQVASAATAVVTNCDDSGPGSLRQAVLDAASGDTITFAMSPACNLITLTTGSIDILHEDLTVTGPGPSALAVSGIHSFPVFQTGDGTATISGLTIENGEAGSGTAGGISANSGSLTVINSVVTGNTNSFGGAGIDSASGGASLTVINSTISNNIGLVGGINASPAGLTVIGSTFVGNSGPNGGGGAIASAGLVNVHDSTFTSNTGCLAAALYDRQGTAEVSSSTFSHNTTKCTAGGSAIFNADANHAVTTVSGSIFDSETCTGAITDGGFNLDTGHDCVTSTANASVIDTASGLDPAGLQPNGGPTRTIALTPGSSAIGLVNSAALCSTPDQRGVTRPTPVCDAGAYETSTVTPSLSIDDVSLNEGDAATTTLTFTVSLSSPAGAGGVTFDITTADGAGAAGATAPDDYSAKVLSGQTIAAGSSSYTFDVAVKGDTTVEPDETFTVNVSDVAGATVSDGQGQGTILNDDAAPVACSPGSFSATGNAPCTLAPPGSFVDTAGATSATPCAKGSFSNVAGAQSCTLAPAGSYVNTTGATSATLCPPGTFSGGPGGQFCSIAFPGKYAAGPGATAATQCPVGTFSASAGAAACDPAPAGSFVATTGRMSATPCAAGTYQPLTGQASCLPADPGSYVPGPGAATETQCLPGTFSASAGATACTLADAGSYVPSAGASSQTLCAPGTFSASAGASSCTLAPPGSFVAGSGATSATPCAAGTYQLLSGQTSCTAVNQAPSFVVGPNQTVLANAAAQTVSPWATAISPGPPSDAGQTVDFIVSNGNTGLFSAQPSVDPNGTLHYTPAAGQFGFATVTVQIHDNGGTTAGGNNLSATQTFTITVNQAPTFAPDTNPLLTASVGQPYGYAFVAAGYPTPTYSLATGAPSWLTIDQNSGLLGGTPATGTTTFTYTVVATNAAGSATSGPYKVTVASPPPASTKADLSASLSCPTSVKIGLNTTCTLTVRNAGPAVAKNVWAALALPPSLARVSNSTGGAWWRNVITWKVASLGANASSAFTVTFKARTTGTATIRAATASTNPDPNWKNNFAATTITLTH